MSIDSNKSQTIRRLLACVVVSRLLQAQPRGVELTKTISLNSATRTNLSHQTSRMRGRQDTTSSRWNSPKRKAKILSNSRILGARIGAMAGIFTGISQTRAYCALYILFRPIRRMHPIQPPPSITISSANGTANE